MDIPQNTQGREATAWPSSDTGMGSRNLNISLGLRDLDVKRRHPDSKQPNQAHRRFVSSPAYGVHSTGSRRKTACPLLTNTWRGLRNLSGPLRLSSTSTF